MASPDRAPRRNATSNVLNVATGAQAPGVSRATYPRQSSGLNPGSVPQTHSGNAVGRVPGADAYKRNPCDLSPENVAVNK